MISSPADQKTDSPQPRSTWRVAGRQAVLALPLYLPSLLLALISAFPVWLGFLAFDGSGMWAGLLSSGGFATFVIESIGAARAPELFPPAVETARVGAAYLGFAAGLLSLFVLLPVQWLAYMFASGGILGRLAKRNGESFLSLSRRWFWPMVRCGLVGGVLLAAMTLLASVPLSLFAILAGAAGGVIPALALIALLVLVRGIGTGYNELVRASLVVRDDRRVRAGYRYELGVLRRSRRTGFLLAIWCGLALAELALIGGGSLLLAAVPAVAVLPAFLAGQALALLAAWLKLLRLAVATDFATQHDTLSTVATYPDA